MKLPGWKAFKRLMERSGEQVQIVLLLVTQLDQSQKDSYQLMCTKVIAKYNAAQQIQSEHGT